MKLILASFISTIALLLATELIVQVKDVKIDTRLTILPNQEIYESEQITVGPAQERIAIYKLVDVYVTHNTYRTKTWYCTNNFDTGLSKVKKEIRVGNNKWIEIPKEQ